MQQFQELRERTIDLLIVRMPRPFLEEDLVAEMLFDEPFQAIAGAGSRWAHRRQIKLAELVHEPWVLPPYDSVPGAFILEIFRANNLQPPRPRIVSLSGQLTVTLIAGGRFVGLLPELGRAIQCQASWAQEYCLSNCPRCGLPSASSPSRIAPSPLWPSCSSDVRGKSHTR